MFLRKELVREGNKTDYPRKGDKVTIEYTGWLYDASKANNQNRGNKFDSSIGRGDFVIDIGVGRVIKGWDEGVVEMSLGEKSVLTIPGDMAYGSRPIQNAGLMHFNTLSHKHRCEPDHRENPPQISEFELERQAQTLQKRFADRGKHREANWKNFPSGFPGLIPANATLIFEVELKGINNKKI